MDNRTKKQRSLNMGAVRSKNTAPELAVRAVLQANGLRVQRHVSALPGSPDVVLRRFKIAIFVNGCFWHGHTCSRGKPPRSRLEFWRKKLTDNRRRDDRVIRAIRAAGWKPITVWECQTKDKETLSRRLMRIIGKRAEMFKIGLSDR